MGNSVIDAIKKAKKEVKKVGKMENKERSACIGEIETEFFKLQKEVYSIISEERVILDNFEFKCEWIDKPYNIPIIIYEEIRAFVNQYGFSQKTVEDILRRKNRERNNEYIYYILVPRK